MELIEEAITPAGPNGFAFKEHKNGEIVISHHGKRATVLRGARADRFIRGLETHEPQLLMARATGNYKRGNERR